MPIEEEEKNEIMDLKLFSNAINLTPIHFMNQNNYKKYCYHQNVDNL